MSDWGYPFPPFAGVMLVAVILAAVWSAVWKGIALWRAGRNAHLIWFIVLLIINTLGILEIIYIFAFSRKKEQPQSSLESAGSRQWTEPEALLIWIGLSQAGRLKSSKMLLATYLKWAWREESGGIRNKRSPPVPDIFSRWYPDYVVTKLFTIKQKSFGYILDDFKELLTKLLHYANMPKDEESEYIEKQRWLITKQQLGG